MEDYQSLSIKNWAAEDQPREKLVSKGIQALSDAELIAILLRSGRRDASAVELARQMLQQVNNNLHDLGKWSVNDFLKIKGIGTAKAVSVVAALELGRRRKFTESDIKPGITSSRDVFEIMGHLLSDLPHEEFWALLLNRSNKVKEKIKVSQGGISGTVTDARLILKPAILGQAASIILCHNHPSGNTRPSEADINLTKKLVAACETMDMKLLDHIIIADKAYFSFQDEGIL